MRVLLITGRLAAPGVRQAVREVPSGIEVGVEVIDTDAAVLAPYAAVKRAVAQRLPEGWELVVVPGLWIGDTRRLADELGVPVVRGPKHFAQLASFLKALAEGWQPPPDRPADEVLAKYWLQKFAKRDRGAPILRIGSRTLYAEGEPLLIAEIVDATEKPVERVLAEAQRYLEEGADIVDVGVPARGAEPTTVAERVKALLAKGVPVSIDTHDPELIEVAVREGAQLVLSVTPETAEVLSQRVKGTPVVVLPSRIPEDPVERKEALQNAIEKVREHGFRYTIADPLLHPPIIPGLLHGIATLALFRRSSKLPVLLGAGNVTELVDADSPGMNALLACLAVEAMPSLVLTTEASWKTYGAVTELRRSLQLATLARYVKSPPCNLGVEAFCFKEKRCLDEPLPPNLKEPEILEPPPRRVKGREYFRIGVDRKHRRILALYYSASGELRVFSGASARRIVRGLIEKGLLTDPGHAAYVAIELERAFTALATHRSYQQGRSVFDPPPYQ